MPSFFSHAISAIAIGKVCTTRHQAFKFWFIGMICASLPDIDILAFKFGIPYSHMFGHRGISHSFFFAFLLAILVTILFFRKSENKILVWIYLFLCTASHGILDAMTSGGLGIAFFAPFSSERFFMPIRPIRVSPIGIEAFFSEWGLQVIKSEFRLIWIPSFILIALSLLIGKIRGVR